MKFTIIAVTITNEIKVAVVKDRNEYQVHIIGYQPDPRIDRDYTVAGIFRSEAEALRCYVPLCKELTQRVA